MGYGYYVLPDGREAGYNVRAECDREGCTEEIDRGLGFLCGNNPDGHRDDDESGCGKYFCERHLVNHNCPNEWGVIRHEFVGEEGDEDECWHKIKLPGDLRGGYACGGPRAAHQPLEN